ncbi:hypothetical protein U0070_006580, partial [Myodes glareolus]
IKKYVFMKTPYGDLNFCRKQYHLEHTSNAQEICKLHEVLEAVLHMVLWGIRSDDVLIEESKRDDLKESPFKKRTQGTASGPETKLWANQQFVPPQENLYKTFSEKNPSSVKKGDSLR